MRCSARSPACKLNGFFCASVRKEFTGQAERQSRCNTMTTYQVQASPQGVPAVEPRAYDWPSLATFMRQAYPKMIQELEKSSRSSAFRGYRLLADTCEGSASRLYCDMTLPRELLSCGLDGMIIQWRHDTRKSHLEAVNYFLLLAENVRLHKQIPSGGSGTHVGALVEGHTSLERTYSCPVVARFPPHRGHTLDVHSSPFERNVFASGGMDREVKVFSLLQLEPVLTIPLPEAATRVRWSPSQPTLLTALQGDGRLGFYDLRRTTAPVAEFTLNAERGAGTSLEYCARSPDLLFVGRGPGNTQVWQLGSKLVAAGEVNQSDLIRDVANGTFAPE
ncbi:hypothetical protein HPB49_009548 [Dermacentor silvarum]|uniref:Uncharacterized protein n=1 Tax=Dermacentor silvarum TaxID=543639 RepID=A0ACB8DYL3_DERSI|nr:hypothetical protein HPB49_009548 [Dermacentor silvarum]